MRGGPDDSLALERRVVAVVERDGRLEGELLDTLEREVEQVGEVLLATLGPELVGERVAREVGLPRVMLRKRKEGK